MHNPQINLISAVAMDGTIGYKNKLLYRIKEDLQYYKAKTIDNIVIVGSKTFKSLPDVALNGRTTIIVSKKWAKNPPENLVDDDRIAIVSNTKVAINVARKLSSGTEKDIFIAGGQKIYEQLIDCCDYCHITWIDDTFENADRHFPVDKLVDNFDIISSSDWNIELETLPRYKFTLYRKK